MMACLWIFTAELFVLVVVMVASVAGGDDICQNEVFDARCAQNEVVVMTTARYGRMESSRCVERDYGYVGCEEDVLPIADQLCSGRRSCQVPIPKTEFDNLKPCPNDLKSHLRAQYQCRKVTSDVRPCHGSEALTLTSPRGLLASVVTEETGSGSVKCPWVLRAQPGQRINLTLWDFSVALTPEPQAGVGLCHNYATVRERHPARSATICSSRQRVQYVYLSTKSIVEVRMRVNRRAGGAEVAASRHFLLEYEVVGCPDPAVPTGAELQRNGDSAEIRCGQTGQTWRLVCDRGTWAGSLGNCTSASRSVFGNVTWGTTTLPFTSSVLVMAAIAVALALIILLCGLIIIKRRRLAPPSGPRQMYESAYKSPDGVAMRPHMQVAHMRPEPPYDVPENEYAYISDIINVSKNSGSNNMSPNNLDSRHLELYKARKCLDYGSTIGRDSSGAAILDFPPPPPSARFPEQARYIGNMEADSFPNQCPTYFDVEPGVEMAGRRSSEVAGSKGQVRGTHASGPRSGNDPSAKAKRYANQSSQEIPPRQYDHLVDDQEPTSNHKSV